MGFPHRAVDVAWVPSVLPSVKALRTEGANNYDITESLATYAIISALSEIELGKNPLVTDEIQRGPELAIFQPGVSARERNGRTVKVFFSP